MYQNSSYGLESLHLLDSLNYLHIGLKSMPKSFDLTCKKGLYPQFFNTAYNLDYVGPYPEPNSMGHTLYRVMNEPIFSLV